MPARLAAVGFLVKGERDIYQDFVRMLDTFFDAIRPRVLNPILRTVDPFGVFSGAGNFYRMVRHFIEGGITGLMRTAYGRILGENYPFTNRPYVARHLDQVANRMVRIPDETFRYIRTAVEEGVNEGEGPRELAERIDNQLLRTGSERWKNRALTVARTESLGAYNFGTLDAFDVVRQETHQKFEKIWLATMDTRTRDTHFIADGQRVPFTHPFIVGGFPAEAPGDPTLPPQEVINCRCTFLVVEPGEMTDMANRGFRPNSTSAAEVTRRAERGIIRAGDQRS